MSGGVSAPVGLDYARQPLETRCDFCWRSCRHSWHLYALRLNLDTLTIDRGEFMRQLRQKGIGTSVHFIPIPLHPYFAPYAGLAHNQCPRALEWYPRLVSLPLYPAMSEEEVDYVAESIKEIVMAAKKRRSVAVAVGVV